MHLITLWGSTTGLGRLPELNTLVPQDSFGIVPRVLNLYYATVCGTGLGRLPELNTLVLTRNRLASLAAAPLAGCAALAKLSLSHNALGDLDGAPCSAW